jgi:hypothetical protein
MAVDRRGVPTISALFEASREADPSIRQIAEEALSKLQPAWRR